MSRLGDAPLPRKEKARETQGKARGAKGLSSLALLMFICAVIPAPACTATPTERRPRPEPRAAQGTHRWHPIRHATVIRRRQTTSSATATGYVCLRSKLTWLAKAEFCWG